MVVTGLEGRALERERQSWTLGNFTFSLPGPGKLPVDCECSHLKTSISTFFPFSLSFWFPFPGCCEPALSGSELYRSSWQCKASHRCCCQEPLVPLAMGDSGHSSYSSDMSPCDYDLFAMVKEPLWWTRYNTRNQLIRAIGRSIWYINKDGVRSLPYNWQKVINKGGEYTEDV